jgi:hypothetical protein
MFCDGCNTLTMENIVTLYYNLIQDMEAETTPCLIWLQIGGKRITVGHQTVEEHWPKTSLVYGVPIPQVSPLCVRNRRQLSSHMCLYPEEVIVYRCPPIKTRHHLLYIEFQRLEIMLSFVRMYNWLASTVLLIPRTTFVL